ncbi:hypothetical protein E2C01_018455 [Portunus trituberculatus]|uniref:Uncharacterized protein n=1 Tax=Portunus trituberculatus TaxID=210409 RepID=A0A5B7DW73_PORTR|nr:hypothetical protein [Portunus trituberculatus]
MQQTQDTALVSRCTVIGTGDTGCTHSLLWTDAKDSLYSCHTECIIINNCQRFSQNSNKACPARLACVESSGTGSKDDKRSYDITEVKPPSSGLFLEVKLKHSFADMHDIHPPQHSVIMPAGLGVG